MDYTFRVRKLIVVSAISCALAFPLAVPAMAANSDFVKPTVSWQCNLSRILDHQGTVVFFKPKAVMSWYGKKGFYKFYDISDETKSIGENLIGKGVVQGEDKKVNSSSIYLNRKYHNFLKATHLKLLVVVSDVKNQTARTSCEWNGPAASGL